MTMQRFVPVLPQSANRPLLIELVDNAKRRIVQSKKGQLIDEAKPDAYLGQENRRVEKETQGRSEQVATQPRRLQEEKILEKNKAKAPPLRRFGVPLLTRKQLVRSQPRSKTKPAWTDFSKSYRGEVDPDYIKGIDEANETALNTREFVFYGYFERIRNRLNQAWKPLLRDHVMRFYRQGRTLAGNKDHVTRILVVLDKKGNVIKVKVLEQSGTRTLDHAAIKAFNQAGPFPNPPKGLVDLKGQIEIRWDFILKS